MRRQVWESLDPVSAEQSPEALDLAEAAAWEVRYQASAEHREANYLAEAVIRGVRDPGGAVVRANLDPDEADFPEAYYPDALPDRQTGRDPKPNHKPVTKPNGHGWATEKVHREWLEELAVRVDGSGVSADRVGPQSGVWVVREVHPERSDVLAVPAYESDGSDVRRHRHHPVVDRLLRCMHKNQSFFVSFSCESHVNG